MSFGKLIFGFMIIGLCFAGTVMLLAQQSLTPVQAMNIGNNTMLDNTTLVNQTAGLVSTTTSFGTGAGVAIIFIVGALVILGALALVAGRKK